MSEIVHTRSMQVQSCGGTLTTSPRVKVKLKQLKYMGAYVSLVHFAEIKSTFDDVEAQGRDDRTESSKYEYSQEKRINFQKEISHRK